MFTVIFADFQLSKCFRCMLSVSRFFSSFFFHTKIKVNRTISFPSQHLLMVVKLQFSDGIDFSCRHEIEPRNRQKVCLLVGRSQSGFFSGCEVLWTGSWRRRRRKKLSSWNVKRVEEVRFDYLVWMWSENTSGKGDEAMKLFHFNF